MLNSPLVAQEGDRISGNTDNQSGTMSNIELRRVHGNTVNTVLRRELESDLVEVSGTDEVSNDTGTGGGWQVGIENDIGTVGEDWLDLNLHVVASGDGFDEIDSLRGEEALPS